MPKFRSKPREMVAVQWTGNNFEDLAEMEPCEDTASAFFRQNGDLLEVLTPSGLAEAEPGDWIAKAGPADYYPIKPDAFERMWERIE